MEHLRFGQALKLDVSLLDHSTNVTLFKVAVKQLAGNMLAVGFMLTPFKSQD